MDLHPQNANFASLLGQVMDFKVTQCDEKARDVVVTRRPMLEAEAHERRKKALEFLSETGGPDAVTRFAQSRIAAVEDRYRDNVAKAGPETTPAEALAAALTDDGYVASTLPSAIGEQLCQHHCPIAHVAERFPQLCEVETEMFSRVLGVHVQRLATIAHGDGVCTTHIPHPRPEPMERPGMDKGSIERVERHSERLPLTTNKKAVI